MRDELAPDLTWVSVDGGAFLMGSDDFYPDESPRHERTVGAFELTATPVTNRQFARFVAATGYVTVAERPLSAEEYPHLDAAARIPGSLVFVPTAGPVDLQDWQQWWRWVPGACWSSPAGPGSSVSGIEDHPVVQIAYADASAFAAWAGGRLPTEAELEFAACGGSTPNPFAWGAERDPGGDIVANTWRGKFPYRNDGALGWRGTSPVASFPANEYGLYDCIGNVWEWSADRYAPRHETENAGVDLASGGPLPAGCGCGAGGSAANPSGGAAAPTVTQRVLKGGSHLCAPEYCLRYRPAARSPQEEDSATTHIGFRVARRRSL
ncbi:Formylglycine-generating enzyme [Leucobacter sp. BZR 635]